MAKRLIYLVFCLSVAANLASALTPLDWRILPAMLVGWFLADLASGAVHMLMDYYPCRPGVGFPQLFFYAGSRESDDYVQLKRQVYARVGPIDRILYDFKSHHPRPDALGRRDVDYLIGSTVLFLALPFSLGLNLVDLVRPLPSWLMGGLTVLIVGGAFSQYFHGTLHRAHNPWIVRAMRRVGLLMTPTAHGLHHATLTRDFATNCGWANPLLNLAFASLRRRGYLPDVGLEPTA